MHIRPLDIFNRDSFAMRVVKTKRQLGPSDPTSLCSALSVLTECLFIRGGEIPWLKGEVIAQSTSSFPLLCNVSGEKMPVRDC